MKSLVIISYLERYPNARNWQEVGRFNDFDEILQYGSRPFSSYRRLTK